jgi:hypothetical protein
MAGSRPGNDALIHLTTATPLLRYLFVAPLDTTSGMVLAGGIEAMIPRMLDILQSPVNFVVGVRKESPGTWELLLSHQGEPLRPFLRGECLPFVDLETTAFGPPEVFDQLAELMEGVAKEYGREARLIAADLVDATISCAVSAWPNWEAWAVVARPDIRDVTPPPPNDA